MARADEASAGERSFGRELIDALRGRERDYTTGRLWRAVVLLAVPMVLEMLMESAFAVVDIYFVAQLGDDAPVAAVGLTEAMLTIVYAVAIGLSMGATALVARRVGEKNLPGAVRAAAQAVRVGVVGGLLIGAPCAYFAPELLAAMNAGPEVVEVGSGYTRIVLGGNVVVLLLFLNNAILRGAGDAGLAMRVLWLSNGINILLDPCLIFGLGPFPELGVTGAAWATLIGRSTGVLYQFWLLRRGTGRVQLRGRDAWRFHPAVTVELLRVSAGGVMQFLIATASWVVLMRLAMDIGPEVVAGYTIAVRIVMFAILPAWGLSNAAATLVGQNLGAGRPERAERAVWLTGAMNMGFLMLVTAGCVGLAPSLLGPFTADASPAVAAVAIDALRILSSGYVFYAWGMVIAQAFNGAGDTVTPTRLNFVFFWLIQVPLAWLLSESIGAHGVFWSVPLAESGLAIASIVLFRRGKWKDVKLAQDP